jgi:hypothetical protein
MPPKGSEWRKAGVVFTGAGFSRAFNLPLSSELWDLGLVANGGAAGAGLLLDDGRKSYPLKYFITKPVPDVELLLTCCEAYLDTLYRVFPETDGLPRMYRDHYLANLAMHIEARTEAVEAQDSGQKLAAWFSRVPREIPIAVLTTNYDRAFERILKASGAGYIYNGGYDIAVPVKKIHGSVNWIKGPPGLVRHSDKWKPLSIYRGHDFEIYNFELEPISWIAGEVVPVIIPPTIRKDYQGHFEHLMREAYQYLDKARRILILGYSFPTADLVVEKLFRNAVAGARKQEIQFVNPSADAIARAREILPLDRTKFLNEPWSISNFDWLLA